MLCIERCLEVAELLNFNKPVIQASNVYLNNKLYLQRNTLVFYSIDTHDVVFT